MVDRARLENERTNVPRVRIPLSPPFSPIYARGGRIVGLVRRFAKPLGKQFPREFESLPPRQFPPIGIRLSGDCFVAEGRPSYEAILRGPKQGYDGYLRYDGSNVVSKYVHFSMLRIQPYTKDGNTMIRNSLIMIGMAVSMMACASEAWYLDGLWDGSAMMGTDTWHLVELNGQAIDADVQVTMQYESNNMVGNGFCSVYRVAPSMTSPTTFRIETIATLEASCPEQHQANEQAFWEALRATTHIQRTAEQLLFLSDEEHTMLVFAP